MLKKLFCQGFLGKSADNFVLICCYNVLEGLLLFESLTLLSAVR